MSVYYLPAVTPEPEPRPAPTRWTTAQHRLHGTWWRIRFALAGLRLALRPSRAPLFAADDEPLPVLEGPAEMVERRPRYTRPARVIDFDAARARLRRTEAH